jgi:hypothetical protein
MEYRNNGKEEDRIQKAKSPKTKSKSSTTKAPFDSAQDRRILESTKKAYSSI